MIKSNNILKNSSMLMLFHIAKMLFPFLTLPYLTRALSTDAYGTVAYVKTVMSYMQIMVDFGFMLSATKDVVLAKDNKQELECVIGDTVFARILLGFVALILLILLTIALPILRNNLLYTFLSFAVVFLSIFLMDFLFRGLEKMHVITVRFIMMKTVSMLLTFIFVKSDRDLILIPVFDIFGSLAAALLVWLEMRKLKLSVRFSGIRKAAASIRDSFLYFLSNAASTSFNALSTLLIGIWMNASEVAYWSVCMQVVTAIQACYAPVSDGIYPEMIKSRDMRIIRKALSLLMPVVTVGCILAYFLAGTGLRILGGDAYLAAVPVFRLLIPALFFGFPAVLFGWPALGAAGKTREVTFSTVFSVLLHLALLAFLVLTDSFTLENLAIARSVTEFSLFIIRYVFYSKYRHLFVDGK